MCVLFLNNGQIKTNSSSSSSSSSLMPIDEDRSNAGSCMLFT